MTTNDRFTWTQEYKKSWEDDQLKAKLGAAPLATQYSRNRRNIIRQLHLVVDASASIEKADYLPSIRNQVTKLIPPFIDKFAQLNPLSALSFMTCSNVLLKHAKAFSVARMLNTIGTGGFSLLNCLSAVVELLKTSNYTRECLIVTASTGTRDTGAYDEVVELIRKHNIKVSIISICGEVSLFKQVCQLSNGVFQVPLDVNHFEILLNNFAIPLESTSATNKLAQFGFPAAHEAAALCSCHFTMHESLYECPACAALVCAIPCDCPVCGFRLISPLSISKSYHCLYPLEPFKPAEGICFTCGSSGAEQCGRCCTVYCADCSRLLHDCLNFCICCQQD
ncbi:transcription initiation factor TFIIH subunit 2 [Pancytospora philotis]|nr:transcription initiation factor TFIIH subunit 2 [Pancytospora philotis]